MYRIFIKKISELKIKHRHYHDYLLVAFGLFRPLESHVVMLVYLFSFYVIEVVIFQSIWRHMKRRSVNNA
jgi:hypothetical protein